MLSIQLNHNLTASVTSYLDSERFVCVTVAGVLDFKLGQVTEVIHANGVNYHYEWGLLKCDSIQEILQYALEYTFIGMLTTLRRKEMLATTLNPSEYFKACSYNHEKRDLRSMFHNDRYAGCNNDCSCHHRKSS